jgi:integrase
LFTVKELKKLQPKKTISAGNGFCARFNPASGSISFLVMRKIKGDPTPKSYKVGEAFKDDPDLNRALLNAQSKATYYARLMSEGIDPKQKEKADKLAKIKKQKTLGELLNEYEHSRLAFNRGNADKTMSDRRGTLEIVYGKWFNRPVTTITREELMEKYYELSSGQTSKEPQAKKGVRYLRSVLNYGINVLNLLDKNPCDVFKNQISMKSNMDNTQFLKPSETVKLCRFLDALLETYGKDNNGLLKEYNLDKKAISQYELQSYNAIKLMLYSGLRLNEVLKLRWKDVYLEATELNEGAYFETVIENRKQGTAFGVPIIAEMREVFSRQKMLQGMVSGVDMKERLKNNEPPKKIEYVFPSPKTDKHMTKVVDAFKYLNQLMPDLISASKLGANQLRHTFATLAYNVGYSMTDIDIMTGHGIRGNTNLATAVYVGGIAEDNRSRFEKVAKAINGIIIKDNQVKEITDSIGAEIANNPKALQDALSKGLLSKNEKKKYNTDALELKAIIKKEEAELKALIKSNPKLPKELLEARNKYIKDWKEVLVRLEQGGSTS